MSEYQDNSEIFEDPTGLETEADNREIEDTVADVEQAKRAVKSTEEIMASIDHATRQNESGFAPEPYDFNDPQEEAKRKEAQENYLRGLAEKNGVSEVKERKDGKTEQEFDPSIYEGDPSGFAGEEKNKTPKFVKNIKDKYKNHPRSNRILGVVGCVLIVCLFLVIVAGFGSNNKRKDSRTADETLEEKVLEGSKKDGKGSVVKAADEDAGIKSFTDEEARLKKEAMENRGENVSMENPAADIPFAKPERERVITADNTGEAQLNALLAEGSGKKRGRLDADGKIIYEDVNTAKSNNGVRVYGDRHYTYKQSQEYQNKMQQFFSALTSSTKVSGGLNNKANAAARQQGNNGAIYNGTENGGSRLYNDGSVKLSSADIQNLAASAGLGGGDTVDNATRNEIFLKNSKTKGDLRNEYSMNTRRKPLTKFEIKAGTVINGVLITGINSDMPGTIIGQVSENVYDSRTGYYLLIPQGSRMIGTYSSHVVFGQKRVLTVWNRIIYPDGSSLNLEGLTGADQAGYSGLKQKINNHYGNLISAALFSSVFVWMGKEATKNDTDRYGRENAAAEAVMEQISSLGARLAERNLNIAPTLTIKPGFRFTIITTKDIAFMEDYIAGTR